MTLGVDTVSERLLTIEHIRTRDLSVIVLTFGCNLKKAINDCKVALFPNRYCSISRLVSSVDKFRLRHCTNAKMVHEVSLLGLVRLIRLMTRQDPNIGSGDTAALWQSDCSRHSAPPGSTTRQI